MIYHLNTNLVPIFSGTYETLWDVVEYDEDGNELSTAYDFNKLMKSIIEAYQDQADNIKSELATPWIKSISFPGGHYSPREYNFSTDRLDMDVTVDQRAMIKYAKSLIGDEAYISFLRDNYSSRSGFWSYTPDTPQGILEAIRSRSDELDQAVGALINYAMRENGHSGEYGLGAEYIAHDCWASNSYMGLDWWVECAECYGKMQWDMDSEWHCTNEDCKVNQLSINGGSL